MAAVSIGSPTLDLNLSRLKTPFASCESAGWLTCRFLHGVRLAAGVSVRSDGEGENPAYHCVKPSAAYPPAIRR